MNDAIALRTTASDHSPALAPGGPVGAERRQSPRFTVLVRTAKVICEHGEFFCIVRDASAEGVRIKVFHPLPSGERFELALADGERHTIVKVWEDGDHAGFRFNPPIDIERLVKGGPAPLRKREISLHCALPALLSARSGECEVELCDIAPSGARIKCSLHLAVRERVRLDCDRLGSMTATVESRWGQFHGLVFDRPFAFDELARLCGVMETAEPAAGPPPSLTWQYLFARDARSPAQPGVGAA